MIYLVYIITFYLSAYYLKHISYIQYKLNKNDTNNSDNLSLHRIFISFVFNVGTDIVGFIPIILMLVFYFTHLFYVHSFFAFLINNFSIFQNLIHEYYIYIIFTPLCSLPIPAVSRTLSQFHGLFNYCFTYTNFTESIQCCSQVHVSHIFSGISIWSTIQLQLHKIMSTKPLCISVWSVIK